MTGATFTNFTEDDRQVGDQKSLGFIRTDECAEFVKCSPDWCRIGARYNNAMMWLASTPTRARVGHPITLNIVALFYLAPVLGQPERAVRLIAAGDTQLAAIGSRRAPGDQREIDKMITLVRDQLDDETFDRLRAEGESMSLEDAIDLVLRED